MEFGTRGYAFIYRSKTAPQKKHLPRSVIGLFVGIDSSTKLFRILTPENRAIIICRKSDFKTIKDNKLPGLEALLDGIARQVSEETDNTTETPFGETEEQLTKVYISTMGDQCLKS